MENLYYSGKGRKSVFPFFFGLILQAGVYPLKFLMFLLRLYVCVCLCECVFTRVWVPAEDRREHQVL